MLPSYSGKCPEGNCCIVKAGDTFYGISRFYNVSLDSLADANPHIEPDRITPGQVVCIPLAAASPAPAANNPLGAKSYTVQPGDTFYSIAKQNNTSLSALLKANPNINPDALLPGQSIYLPRISSTYSNEEYGIKLIYPYRWSKISKERYEGIDGFFHLVPVSNTSTQEEVCAKEAHHKLKPYGSHPEIVPCTAGGREACWIIPSADQMMEMHGQAALVIKYGKPRALRGVLCRFLIIRTDKNHLKDITNSLEFLDI
jgi:LysM repeat protein